jgi:hypothetical protein
MAVVLGVPGVDGRWWEDFGVKGGSSLWLDDWLDEKLDSRELRRRENAGRRLRTQGEDSGRRETQARLRENSGRLRKLRDGCREEGGNGFTAEC